MRPERRARAQSPSPEVLRVSAIGWKAHAALAGSYGETRVLAPLTESAYVTAGTEILWLAPAASMVSHPRAIAVPVMPRLAAGEPVRIGTGGCRPWRAQPLVRRRDTAPRLLAGARWLRASLRALGSPAGLAILCGGNAPASRGTIADALVRHAAPAAAALGHACTVDDPDGAEQAAVALLGLGPGLTPAGDDYVGGAYFARRLLALAAGGDTEAWSASAGRVLARAVHATHPISVALLGDLMAGDGHAPLHDLAAALAEDGAPHAALGPARRLIEIGHTSGWDILSGFLAGLRA